MTLPSSIIDLKEGVKLLHEFFHFLLFDFSIKRIYNAVPINLEGLYKIYSTNLKLCQKGPDQLKIIYYARNKAKCSWLHLSPEATMGIIKRVADSLKTMH